MTGLRSAGAVVVRDGRVLVIHRDGHLDWTFPKGKLEAGESDEQAAVRELEEEVGLRVTLRGLLGETRYPRSDGRLKTVAYFRAEGEGEAQALDGVDEVRWATPDEARELLTYDRDRALLDRL